MTMHRGEESGYWNLVALLEKIGLINLADSVDRIKKLIDVVQIIDGKPTFTLDSTSTSIEVVLHALKRCLGKILAEGYDHIDMCLWLEDDKLKIQLDSNCNCIVVDNELRKVLTSEKTFEDFLAYAYVYKYYVPRPLTATQISIDDRIKQRALNKYNELKNRLVEYFNKLSSRYRLCLESHKQGAELIHVKIRSFEDMQNLLKFIASSVKDLKHFTDVLYESSLSHRMLIKIDKENVKNFVDTAVTELVPYYSKVEKIYQAIIDLAVEKSSQELAQYIHTLANVLAKFKALNGIVMNFVGKMEAQSNWLVDMLEAVHGSSSVTETFKRIMPLVLQALLLIHLYLVIEHCEVGRFLWLRTKELLNKLQEIEHPRFRSEVLRYEGTSKYHDITRMGLSIIIEAILQDLVSLQNIETLHGIKPSVRALDVDLVQATLCIHSAERKESGYSVMLGDDHLGIELKSKMHIEQIVIATKSSKIAKILESFNNMKQLLESMKQRLERASSSFSVSLIERIPGVIASSAHYSLQGKESASMNTMRELWEFLTRNLMPTIIGTVIPRYLTKDHEIRRIHCGPETSKLVVLRIEYKI